MLDVKQLRTYYEARPFRPFEIVLRDGRVASIDDPVFVGWMEERKIISFAYGPEAIETARFDDVIALRPVGPAGRSQT